MKQLLLINNSYCNYLDKSPSKGLHFLNICFVFIGKPVTQVTVLTQKAC